jgi:hypothetical protein
MQQHLAHSVCFLQQELRGKLLAEAESSAAANAAVAVCWGAVLGLDVPQELFQAIEEQRMACEAVIASKDRLIAGALPAAAACTHLAGVTGRSNSMSLAASRLPATASVVGAFRLAATELRKTLHTPSSRDYQPCTRCCGSQQCAGIQVHASLADPSLLCRVLPCRASPCPALSCLILSCLTLAFPCMVLCCRHPLRAQRQG